MKLSRIPGHEPTAKQSWALKVSTVAQLQAYHDMYVAATGADTLDAEILAGVLLDAIGSKDVSAKEAWRAKGAVFFQRRGRKGGRTAGGNGDSAGAQPGADPASGSGTAPD